jgi:hypothetical protein
MDVYPIRGWLADGRCQLHYLCTLQLVLMPESRLELKTTLEGSGSLLLEGHQTPVKYIIRIFQEMLTAGTGEVPGLLSAAGQLLELKPADAVKTRGITVKLTLNDGRKCDVIVTDQAGSFQVSGPIA